jgi:hypothetical protein
LLEDEASELELAEEVLFVEAEVDADELAEPLLDPPPPPPQANSRVATSSSKMIIFLCACMALVLKA